MLHAHPVNLGADAAELFLQVIQPDADAAEAVLERVQAQADAGEPVLDLVEARQGLLALEPHLDQHTRFSHARPFV
ncbi:hypothetical protein FQZ97_1145120 [compost metagenome]